MKILASFALLLCLSSIVCAQQLYYVPTTVVTYENRVTTVPVVRNILVPIVPTVPVAPIAPVVLPVSYVAQPVYYVVPAVPVVYYPVVQRRVGCGLLWKY